MIRYLLEVEDEADGDEDGDVEEAGSGRPEVTPVGAAGTSSADQPDLPPTGQPDMCLQPASKFVVQKNSLEPIDPRYAGCSCI